MGDRQHGDHRLAEHSGAGLMFRVDERVQSYFAFYRCPGKGLSFCRVAGGKMERIWTDQLIDMDDDEFVRLGVCGHRNRVELSVDASIVFTFDTKTVGGRDVGLSAMGTGVFEFDDFALYVRNS